jgi:hypothetical protein
MSANLHSFVSYAGWIACAGVALKTAYAINTRVCKTINVESKYEFVKNGSTKFMVIDDTGEHFEMKNSYLFWKWTAAQDFQHLKMGKTRFEMYGSRIPLLGVYPTIFLE